MEQLERYPFCILCNKVLSAKLTQVCDAQTLQLFSVLQCHHCGLEQTWPVPEDLSLFYPSQYYGSRHGFTADFCVQRRMKWVNHFCTSGKLLDIGCGDGMFLLAAQKRNWDVMGVEMNPQLARSHNLRVYDNLNELKPYGPFDCITLWHSLEHMKNPQEILTQVQSLLATHGVLLIAVPNAHGWQSRLFGKNWLHRDVPRHLYHFGPQALHHLLHANKFESLKWWHQEFEYDLLGWSQSLLNKLFRTPNGFFNLLTGKKSSGNFFTNSFHLLIGVFFSILALPFVPLSAFAKSGGTVIVAVRKVGQP